MITSKRTFILTISSIIDRLHLVDTESKMMCIEGLMQGHGVTWRTFSGTLSVPFLNPKDYFIHQANSGAFGRYSRYADIKAICSMCMDFTILEAGNRVNMAENDGPY